MNTQKSNPAFMMGAGNNTTIAKPLSALQLLRTRKLCTMTEHDDEIVYTSAAAVVKAMEEFAANRVQEHKRAIWQLAGIVGTGDDANDPAKLQQLAEQVMKNENLASSVLMVRAFILGMKFAAEAKAA